MIVANLASRSIGRTTISRALLYNIGQKGTPLLGTTTTSAINIKLSSNYSTRSTSLSSPTPASLTSSTVLQKDGLVDNNGLTIFNTLHELQEVSCTVFGKNELFGAYNEISGQFEYLTYDDFGTKVKECRTLLRHLGTYKTTHCV
jgi:hypothetical protein